MQVFSLKNHALRQRCSRLRRANAIVEVDRATLFALWRMPSHGPGRDLRRARGRRVHVTDLLGEQIVSLTRQAAIKRALIQLLAGTGRGRR